MGVRNYPNKPRIYFDMDGVLADYNGEAKKRNIDVKQVKLIPDVYSKLAVMNEAILAVNMIAVLPFDMWVLTKCPKENNYSATDKLFWIQKHFPIFGDKIIMTPDKGCVGSQRDYLIDDHPEWANASSFPGVIIHFQNNWMDVVQFFKNESIKYEI